VQPQPVPTATLTGTITTGTGSAKAGVSGVSVIAAGKSTQTDAQGRYSLAIENPDKFTVVLARKDGYLSMSKQAPVHAEVTTTQDITLYAENARTTFAATAGKTLEIDGARIDIPANAIKDANGAAYNGTVTISASYRNPTTAEGVDAFPQPYAGLDGSNTGILQTVGVIEVRLLDANGQPLQLRSPATLTYPGVSAVDNGAASIPLWWYDDTRAIWVREGQANRLTDGRYQGQVTHFTQWNLDAFWSGAGTATITACIKFQNGATQRNGIQMTLYGPGVSHPFFSGPLAAGNLEIINAPANVALKLIVQDAGDGKTTEVAIPAVPPGGNKKLDCLTLVGTDGYGPPQPLPQPPPVPPDVPWFPFTGMYIVPFHGTALDPITMLPLDPSTRVLDHGWLQILVTPDGNVNGTGITQRPGGEHPGDYWSWNLNVAGFVDSSGYVQMWASPQSRANSGPTPPNPPSLPPYGAITFMGNFFGPGMPPRGTWVYEGYMDSGVSYSGQRTSEWTWTYPGVGAGSSWAMEAMFSDCMGNCAPPPLVKEGDFACYSIPGRNFLTGRIVDPCKPDQTM